ncbi:MAG: CBS domain-containing protein [Thermoanaerobacteraceae bacterium]|nr:CBS domain-containing protein [Thermoanaerobacteraceae bacterium]
MSIINEIYFSRLMSKPVYDTNGILLGHLVDMYATLDEEFPRVVSIIIRDKRNSQIELMWKKLEITKNKNISFIVDRPTSARHQSNGIFLAKNLLDKQIVDVNGKKVIRVNDILIVAKEGNYYINSVDTGFSGLLRRLGLVGLSKKINMDILIPWHGVEPLEREEDSLKLVIPYKKLLNMHPADLADILEDMSSEYRTTFINSLDEERAADILEEIEPEVQKNIIESLYEDKAVKIIENMSSDDAADLLENLDEEEADSILNHMEIENAEEIRELMDYEEDEVGSIMTTEYISFSPDMTVEETLRTLRELKPSSDVPYYLYVQDIEEHLVGIVSLRDLVVSTPDTMLRDIMSTNVITLKDTDPIRDAAELFIKYGLLAIPVVDENNVLSGVLMVNDIIDEISTIRRRWFTRMAGV